MKKRRIFFKITIFFILILLAGHVYLNYYFLPVQVKRTLTARLEDLTNRKVSLEELSYIPFKGIVLTNLIIYPSAADETRPEGDESSISVKEISFNILPLDFIKKNIIIIPELKLNGLYLYLERDKKGEWNIVEIVSGLKKTRLPEQGARPQKYNFFLEKINLANTTIDFIDYGLKQPFSERLSKLNLNAKISIPDLSVNFNGSGILGEFQPIRFKGQYQAVSNSLSWQLNMNNFDVGRYAEAYIPELPVSIGQPEADIELDLRLSLNADKKISITTISSIKKCQLNWQDYALEADINLTAKIETTWPLPTALKYEVKIELPEDTSFSLPSKMPFPPGHISGLITLTPDNLKLDKIQIAWPGVPVSLSGWLKDFKNLYLKLDVQSDAKISEVIKLLPEKFTAKISKITVSGKSHSALQVEGQPSDWTKMAIAGTVDLDKCSLKYPPLLKTVEDIVGRVAFDKNSFNTSRLKFKYNQVEYGLDLNCRNLAQPVLEVKLTSDFMNVDTIFKIDKDVIRISKFDSRLYDSDISAGASISNIKEPSSLALDIKGKTALLFSDLEKTYQKAGLEMPAFIKALKSYSVEARLNSDFQFTGPLNNRARWQIKTRTDMPFLKIKGYDIEKVSSSVTMQNSVIEFDSFKAAIYNGLLEGKGTIDFRPDNFEYEAGLSLTGLDLRRLIEASPAKDKKKDISGLIDVNLKLNGYGKDLSTLKGEGTITGKEGKLEILILERISSLLKFPFLGKFTFDSVEGQFKIANQMVIIPDLKISGPEANLLCSGTIGFDQKLDLVVNVELVKSFYEQIPLVNRVGAIFNEVLGKYIIPIKIRGTLADPKPSLAPVTESIKKLIEQGIVDIFKDLFPGGGDKPSE